MRAVAALPLFLVACVGGQSGENPVCEETTEVAAAADPIEGLDGPFSADDLLAFVDGQHVSPGTWSDDTTTDVTVELGSVGEIRHVLGTADPEANVICPSRIEVDLDYAFDTADGRLSEAGATTLIARSLDDASVAGEWLTSELAGTWTAPAGADGLRWSAQIARDGTATGKVVTVERESAGSSTTGESVESVLWF